MTSNISRYVWKPDDLVAEVKGKKSAKIILGYKGAAASGNRMHAGRPGMVGGSSSVAEQSMDARP